MSHPGPVRGNLGLLTTPHNAFSLPSPLWGVPPSFTQIPQHTRSGSGAVHDIKPGKGKDVTEVMAIHKNKVR